MKRRLFNILSALSLVLCLATAVLWMRSYRGGDELVICVPTYSKGAELAAVSVCSAIGVVNVHCEDNVTGNVGIRRMVRATTEDWARALPA